MTTTVLDDAERWNVRHRVEVQQPSWVDRPAQLRSASLAGRRWWWRMEGGDQWESLAIGKRPSGEKADNPVDDLATVELPSRRSAPFVLWLKADDVRDASCISTPLSVAGARALTQVVEVRTTEAKRLQVFADGWRLTEKGPAGGTSLHSRWVPQPGSRTPRLEFTRADASRSLPLAEVTNASLESTFVARATSQHRFRFAVENRTEDGVACTLPGLAHSARWRRLDDAAATRTAVDGKVFTLPLKHTRAPQQFEVEFSIDTPLLKHGGAGTCAMAAVERARHRWRVERSLSNRLSDRCRGQRGSCPHVERTFVRASCHGGVVPGQGVEGRDAGDAADRGGRAGGHTCSDRVSPYSHLASAVGGGLRRGPAAGVLLLVTTDVARCRAGHYRHRGVIASRAAIRVGDSRLGWTRNGSHHTRARSGNAWSQAVGRCSRTFRLCGQLGKRGAALARGYRRVRHRG